MPYRRLPNTDNARLKALRAAYKMGKELPPFKLAFSQRTFNRVQSFLPGFEKVILEYKHGFHNQVDKSKDYARDLRKAKLYISHFIQVVNMAISRGELPASVRKYYNMSDDLRKLPTLNSETEIIRWGENLIQGETRRVREGQSPITNPTIAVVKVYFEKFMDAHKFQKTLQKSTNRSLMQLTDLRKQADDIILNVWNETEEAFQDLNDAEKREKCAAYGLVYVFRKSEIKQINFSHELQGMQAH